MNKRILAFAIFASFTGLCAQEPKGPVPQLEASIPLPNVKGSFDHFAVGVKGNRLYVPATNSLLVTDSGPEDAKKGYVRVVSCDTYAITKSIKVMAAADSSGNDPAAHLMYVDTGGLEAKMNSTVISVIDSEQAASIKKGPQGKISIFVPELKRLYVAVSAAAADPAKVLAFKVN